jgi:hypothetical protein
MKSIFIILLGSNILSILQDRINTLFNFTDQIIQNNNLTKKFETKLDMVAQGSQFYTDFLEILDFLKIKTKLGITNELSNHNAKLETINQISITLFLSGGIKNKFVSFETEAQLMKKQIDEIINMKNYKNYFIWNYVLDEYSTNTAENIYRASEYINKSTNIFDDLYIITSSFHQARAHKILKLIDNTNNFKWLLGDYELSDSQYWENIHIQNIFGDINKLYQNTEQIFN